MELQLISAAFLMFAISFAALFAGRKLSRHLQRARTPLFAALVLVTSVYASLWVGRIENTAIFPVGSAVLLSNFTPVLVCFLAGYAWGIPGVQSHRGAFVLSAMVTLGGTFLLAPLLRPLLMPIEMPGKDRWSDGICLQTHEASCGPAAAATLLRHHGIDASEQEMAKACLTSRAGTEPLALYRGLMNRARAAGYVPRLASGRPEDWEKLDQFPVLVMVAPAESAYDQPSRTGRLRQLLGRSSDGHAVVIFGRDANGVYQIGDPASGHASWDAHALQRFFSGQAIYLRPQRD